MKAKAVVGKRIVAVRQSMMNLRAGRNWSDRDRTNVVDRIILEDGTTLVAYPMETDWEPTATILAHKNGKEL